MESASPALNRNSASLFKQWPIWIGYGALLWSLLYGFFHLYWLFGGEGYPFVYDINTGPLSAMINYLPAQIGGFVFVVVCLLGIGISIAMQRPQSNMLPHWLLLGYAWIFAGTLLLFVPDASLIMIIAYAFLLQFDFNWLMLNQIICIVGALSWGFAALVYQRRVRNACDYCGRTEAHESFFLTRYRKWITIIAVLAPLPYAISRFVWAFWIDPQFAQVNPMGQITALVFGLICIGGSILTLGLIQRWGEVFPRWLPLPGNKRVPIMLAVLPASLIAIAITAAGVVFTSAFLGVTLHLIPADGVIFSQIWSTVGPMVFWIPWGVALGLATIAYYYHRRGQCAQCGRK